MHLGPAAMQGVGRAVRTSVSCCSCEPLLARQDGVTSWWHERITRREDFVEGSGVALGIGSEKALVKRSDLLLLRGSRAGLHAISLRQADRW